MSQVELLVKQKLNPRLSDSAPAANRITVRLNDKAHWKLVSMSTRFGMSKSATAEDLLESAISDAFKLYFSLLGNDEKADILHDLCSTNPEMQQFELEDEALELVDEATLQMLSELYRENHPEPLAVL